MARDIFISYKNEDQQVADRLCDALERQGLRCWIASRDIPAGQPWASAIVNGLKKSANFVLILSRQSVAARQVGREVELADANKLPLYTFRVDNVEPPPELMYFLNNLQWLDAFGDRFDIAVGRLVDAIREPPSGEQSSFARAAIPQTTPTPGPTPPTTQAARKAPWMIWSGVGAAVLAAVIGTVILLRPSETKAPVTAVPTTATEEDAKQITPVASYADLLGKDYLPSLNKGELDAAWNFYTVDFRKNHNKAAWEAQAKERIGKNQLSFEGTGLVQTDTMRVFRCGHGGNWPFQVTLIKSDKGWLVDDDTYFQK